MDTSGLRRRKHLDDETANSPVRAIASFDVFPKVPEDFKKPTSCGALLTLICGAVIILLVVAEFLHYRMPNFDYDYSVDKDFSTKLPLSLDITIAMPCETIGADIVDLVNENIDIDGGINEEDAYFELSEADNQMWQMRRKMNQYISEEYHAIHRLLWIQGYRSAWSLPAPRKLVHRPGKKPDACRFYGLVHVNKMAGNFHVLSGKALHGADLHAHISLFVSTADSNFSHRIERLGFGAHDVAIVNPLDGEEKVTTKHSVSYQYNLKVVPTEVQTRSANVMTYQYGVQQMERVLNHSTGTHGIPGIFIKYDINPLKITVIEQPIPMIHFLVRVCGVVGGVFATTGILSSIIQLVMRCIFGKSSDKKMPFYKQDSLPDGELHSRSPLISPSTVSLSTNPLFTHLHTDNGSGSVKIL